MAASARGGGSDGWPVKREKGACLGKYINPIVSPLLLLPLVIFFGMAAVFFAGMSREDPDALPSALVGGQAPPLNLTQLGSARLLSDEALRDGGVKLVNFWASWCGPCRVEHPSLEALSKEGIAVYGVNYKDDPDKALAFLAELGDPYAAAGADRNGRNAIDWGVYGVPETYVLDADGNIVLRFAGPVTGRVMREKIRPAMDRAGK